LRSHTSKHLKTSYSRLQGRVSQLNVYQLQSSATPSVALSSHGELSAAVPRAPVSLFSPEAALLRSSKGQLLLRDRAVPTNWPSCQGGWPCCLGFPQSLGVHRRCCLRWSHSCTDERVCLL